MRGKRKASPAQLYALNSAGALLRVEPGAGAPIGFEEAWAALQAAEADGHWKPNGGHADATTEARNDSA